MTEKSPTKFSDIKTFIKSVPENLPIEQFMLEQINSVEILKLIKNMGNNCSTGFDNIRISLIKLVVEYVSSPLTHTKHSSFETVVNKWKRAGICPIPKMSEPESIVDYGPHSVPPTFSKAYESYSMKNNKFY